MSGSVVKKNMISKGERKIILNPYEKKLSQGNKYEKFQEMKKISGRNLKRGGGKTTGKT